jgi:hypothetical protein
MGVGLARSNCRSAPGVFITRNTQKVQGVTEILKVQNQMAWVGAINNIRNAAEEIILSKLIYN